jgi:transcriptional regulator with XRE-family HTH domain
MAAARRDARKAPEALVFGQTLRRFRNGKGWSQEQLADRAGITLNYVGNLERGEQGPSLHMLVRLARALEVDLPTLLGEFKLDSIRKLRLN